MASPSNILIVDDHELLAYGIKNYILEFYSDTEFDIALNGHCALLKIQNRAYDIYIIDLELEDMSGFDLIRKTREIYPASKIIVCTMHEGLWYIKELKAMNVNGIVLKSSCKESINKAIAAVSNGEIFYCKRFDYLYNGKSAAEKNDFLLKESFSRLELQLLRLIGQGLTSIMIGEEMGWAKKTEEHYRKRLFDKFGVSNATQLIAKAMKEGYLKKEEV